MQRYIWLWVAVALKSIWIRTSYSTNMNQKICAYPININSKMQYSVQWSMTKSVQLHPKMKVSYAHPKNRWKTSKLSPHLYLHLQISKYDKNMVWFHISLKCVCSIRNGNFFFKQCGYCFSLFMFYRVNDW